MVYTVPLPLDKVNQQTREKIGEAIYLLVYLIHRCDWEDGRLWTNFYAIAEHTGFPLRTIRRWTEVLAEAGIITAKSTRTGTLVTIADYEPIARARRVRTARASPGQAAKEDAAKQSTPPIDGTERTPETANLYAASGTHRTPDAAYKQAGNGTRCTPSVALCTPPAAHDTLLSTKSIFKIKDKIRVQTDSLSSCVSGKGAVGLAATGFKTGGDIFDYSDPWAARLGDVRKRLAGMDAARRDEIEQMALMEMARDQRPFVRIFARASESGKMEPAGTSGEEMMLRRVWEIMHRESEVRGPESIVHASARRKEG